MPRNRYEELYSTIENFFLNCEVYRLKPYTLPHFTTNIQKLNTGKQKKGSEISDPFFCIC